MKHIRTLVLTLFVSAIIATLAFAAQIVLSPQNLSVDGNNVTCEKYNIDGSNYFKLRDLAYLVNNTGSQFSVDWDTASQTVSITTGAAYTPNGSELDVSGGDKSQTAVVSAQTIMIDSMLVSDLSVYNIGGNNYFKLRDLGERLNFAVNYDGGTNTAVVETIELCNHKWDKGKVTKEATCTEDGIKEYTCSLCDNVKAETIAPLGHKIGSDKYCSRCHEYFPVKATGISFNETVLNLEIGEEHTLTISYSPSNADSETFVWSSSETGVCTVSNGKVYAKGVGIATVTARSADGQLVASCSVNVKKVSLKIILRDSLPKKLSYYDYSDNLDATWTVTDFRYKMADYNDEYDSEVTVELYFNGIKDYDKRGSGQSSSCKISWKLYDEDGYVVESDTCYSPSVCVGDRFRDAKDYIFDLAPDTYYLELLSTNN